MAIISRDNNNKPILNAEYESMFPEGWQHLSLLLRGRLGSWWDPANYDYYYWDDRKKKLVQKFNDRALLPGEYFRWAKGTQVLPTSTSTTLTSTSTTSGTASEAARPFTGLNLGTPKPTASLQTTSNYNLDWYKENRNKLEEYLKLGELYNNAIKGQNLDYTNFRALLKFLNPSIYKEMDTNNEHGVEKSEYDNFMQNLENKKKFYESFNNNNWLNLEGLNYYTFFKDNNGLDKIQSYNDHLRMLYGEDLTLDGKNDNGDIINYLKNSPAYADDDKYKLARAYSLALREGNRDLANRLSLYMIGQGTLHYGYGDHFDLKHQESRWQRRLGNGLTVEKFLDWVYNYYNEHPDMNKETLYNIVRNATKHNFKLDEGTWRNFGDGWVAIRDAYANALRLYKEGGQIFNMLFI